MVFQWGSFKKWFYCIQILFSDQFLVMYDKPGPSGEHEFYEKKWLWAVGGNGGSKEGCISSAHADLLIAAVTQESSDTLITSRDNLKAPTS